jgi:UDP-N-acetylglucosamine 2-epimerase (non-hydrolysing)
VRPRVSVVLGTRPEAIKLAPVVRALAGAAETRVVLSGQHGEMVDDLLIDLDLHSHARLAVMRDRQSLNGLASRLCESLGSEFAQQRPDAVVVQGDTTTAMCAALAAFHEKIPVAHVEAGLRTGDRGNPFPEEANRRLISTLARWHFAPTAFAAANLVREGYANASIEVTGNTVIDSLSWVHARGLGRSHFPVSERRRVLVTLHRRETQGAEMAALSGAIRRAADDHDLEVLVPLHRNPRVRESLVPALVDHPRIHLIEPLGYLDFIATLSEATIVLTDSGGVQEEAPSLNVPVLIARSATERSEAIEAGCAMLIGTHPLSVRDAIDRVLNDAVTLELMRSAPNPFGDGSAAARITGRLVRDLADGDRSAVGRTCAEPLPGERVA